MKLKSFLKWLPALFLIVGTLSVNAQPVVKLRNIEAAPGSGYTLYSDAQGKWYAVTSANGAVNVNLTPIAYYPSTTGNPANNNEIVIDPDGAVWVIDEAGEAIMLKEATSGGETVLTAGVNVTITGTGTSGDPYIINSPLGGGDVTTAQLGDSTALLRQLDTTTVLIQDSILVYSVANVEVGRDTISGSGGIANETDPTVPSHVKTITTTDITNWNTDLVDDADADATNEIQDSEDLEVIDNAGNFTSTYLEGVLVELFNGMGGSSIWTQTGSNIYYNTGNVGIGIDSSASEALEFGIHDRIKLNGSNAGITITGGYNSEFLKTENGAAGGSVWGMSGSASQGMIFWLDYLSTSSYEYFHIKRNVDEQDMFAVNRFRNLQLGEFNNGGRMRFDITGDDAFGYIGVSSSTFGTYDVMKLTDTQVKFKNYELNIDQTVSGGAFGNKPFGLNATTEELEVVSSISGLYVDVYDISNRLTSTILDNVLYDLLDMIEDLQATAWEADGGELSTSYSIVNIDNLSVDDIEVNDNGNIQLKELSTNGASYIQLQAPASLTTSSVKTLPAAGSGYWKEDGLGNITIKSKSSVGGVMGGTYSGTTVTQIDILQDIDSPYFSSSTSTDDWTYDNTYTAKFKIEYHATVTTDTDNNVEVYIYVNDVATTYYTNFIHAESSGAKNISTSVIVDLDEDDTVQLMIRSTDSASASNSIAGNFSIIQID